MRTIELPYGREPRFIQLAEDSVVVDLPVAPPAAPLCSLLDKALAHPIGTAPLANHLHAGDRITLVVSDTTRDEPRGAMVRAVLEHIARDVVVTLAVANGTHGPCDVTALGIEPALLARARIVNHDAHDPHDMVLLGTTGRGTPLRVHRCLVETDAVVALGRIKPHYFAGFGAGAKALFPGLGANDDIRRNHLLKREPGARAGVVDGNPCREDLEEVADLLPVPAWLLNVVTDPAGAVQTAVAGGLREAFRAGAAACAPLFTVSAPTGDVVIVSDQLPLTATLYQACKLAATGAPLVRAGGALVIVAECGQGTGPVETINQGIWETGIKPRLPVGARVYLVSSLRAEQVEPTFATWAGSVEDAVGAAPSAVVLRRAGVMIVA